MTKPIQIRMGGYGPATTGFSKSLKFIGDKLEAEFGDRIAVEYIWNVMDHGHKAEDILRLVESGEITLGRRQITAELPQAELAAIAAWRRLSPDAAVNSSLTEPG